MIEFDECTIEYIDDIQRQIYHNKWQFVKPTYTGFDIEQAKERTKEWNSIPGINQVKSKIGYRKFWNQLLQDNGVEL